MKRRWIIGTVVLFSSLILICGCGKDEKPPKPTVQDLINQGWTKFDAGKYAGASADFNAAIGMSVDTNEAYLGLGWAELRQSHGGLAENAFAAYLLKVTDTNDDAKAGLAFAYHAQQKFQNAIDTANIVLLSVPNWKFSHDSRIDSLDLALILAQSYYGIGDYSQSLVVYQRYFDHNFNPDINTDAGREELADKIESKYTG